MRRAVLILFLVLIASPSWAVKRYISTTGNDANSCVASQSTTTAKRNFGGANGALACMTGAGDILQALGGTYTEDLTLDNAVPSGTSWTAGNFATIEPFSSEAVTIASAGNSVQLTIRNSHYVLIRGLKFDGTNGSNNLHALSPPAYTSLPVSGVQNNISFGCQGANCAHHIRFENNEVYYSAYGPMQANLNCDFLEIRNNYFHHHSKVENVNGFYMGSKNTTFDGNRVETFGGTGIVFWQQSTNNVINPVIKNNILKDIGIMWASDSGNRDCCGVAGCVNCTCSSGANCNNRMPVGFVNIKGGPIFVSRGDGGLIYNNVMSNSVGGIHVSYGVNNCGVYNNTVFGNVVQGGGFGDVNAGIVLGSAGGGANSCVVRNNIVHQPGVTNPPPMANLGANNTLDNNQCSSSSTGCTTVSGTSPFVSAPSNLQLSPGSLPINAGVTISQFNTDILGVSRPQGPAWDRGAYEWAGVGVTPDPDTLAAWWKFDETAADPALDSSGNGFTLTANGNATRTTGIIGPGATILDGTGDYWSGAGGSLLRPTNTFGIAAQWRGTTAKNHEIFTLSDNYGMEVLSDGRLSCYFYDGTYRFAFSTAPPNGPNLLDGVNHCLACSYDGSTIRAYADGILQGSTTVSSTISYALGTAAFVGHSPGAATWDAQGVIDQVRVYRGELSPTGITNVCNEVAPSAGFSVIHTGWYAANAAEGVTIGTPDTSLNHVMTNPLGVRWAIAKADPGSVTEFFGPHCRVLSSAGAVITDWTKVGNSFGTLGVRYLADSQIALGQATSSLLPTDAGFTAILGLFFENPIDDVAPYNANQRLTLAQGQKADVEARFEFGAPLAAGQQVECRPQREDGTPFTSYAQQGIVQSTTSTSVRVGLHYTEEEIAIWQQRSVNGPYKDAGDVRTNSPGDWTNILANATAFGADAPPKESHWVGQVAATCVQPNDVVPMEGNRRMGDTLRDTAFAWLITGNTAYLTAAKAELLLQAAEAGTNFADATRWCPVPAGDTNPFFDIAAWFIKLTFAYDYIRPALLPGGAAPDASAITTLDTWFLNGGLFWEAVVQDGIGSRYAVSARTGLSDPADFALSSGGTSNANTLFIGYHYCGGTRSNLISGKYTNRQNALALAFSLPGVMLEHAALKNKSKRYVMEALIYATWPSGHYEDYDRMVGAAPQQGWAYAADAVGKLMMIADAFARAGDTSLYDFTTATGAGLDTTAGAGKSLRLLMQTHAKYVNVSLLHYGINEASPCAGTVNDRVGPESATFHSNRDTFWPISNLYYKDINGANNVRSEYLRTAAGAPGYPASPEGGGYYVWGGPSGLLPGVLFMFGQMEGVVSPYGTTAATSSASSLRTGGSHIGGTSR